MAEESHNIYSRFISVPIQILDQLSRGIISPREALFMGLVDGYSNHSKGRKCIASNAYLAKQLGVSVKSVERMISHLIRVKLLRVIHEGGVRLMQPEWPE